MIFDTNLFFFIFFFPFPVGKAHKRGRGGGAAAAAAASAFFHNRDWMPPQRQPSCFLLGGCSALALCRIGINSLTKRCYPWCPAKPSAAVPLWWIRGVGWARSTRMTRKHWCLLFVLIRQGLRGGAGPQRYIEFLFALPEKDTQDWKNATPPLILLPPPRPTCVS